MQQVNIALISTLYNSKGADFYKEIYFPVIKYAAMSIFYETNDSRKYYNILALQERITEKIGIKIPVLVLRNSIKILSRLKNQDVSLELYQKGDYFVIRKNWDADINLDIERQSDVVSNNFRELNLYFREFLKTERLHSEKEFADFFLTYAEEVSNYINSLSTNIPVNEEFVNIVRFIEWLKKQKPDLYDVVNNLLWGSIVAGFLQRNNVELGIKVVETVDYYLDTSLVLSMLKLDSEENIIYALDLLRIIKESGSTPCVHSLTIREIKRILNSVEVSQAPKPGSSIEQAWASQGLSLSTILHIKNSLERILQDELGIFVKQISSSSLDEIEKKYKNNFDVKALAKERGSYDEDKVREIHDVFMKDYVNKLNIERGGAFIENQSAYFVTLNNDLIFFASKSGIVPSVIHAGKVIMSLWLHSSKSENIKKESLAEVMSRCYAMNQTDVRHRLKVFHRHYKDCSLTKDDISQMYSSLIRRSASTISDVDRLVDIEISDEADKDAISREIIMGVVAAVNKESAEREASMQSLQSEIDDLNQRIASMDAVLKDAKRTNTEQDSAIKKYLQQTDLDQDTIAALKKETEILKKISDIDSKLHECYIKKVTMDNEMQSSINQTKFWIILILEIIAAIALIGLLAATIVYRESKDKLIGFSIGSIIPLIGLVLRLKDMYILSPGLSKEKVREEQVKYWIAKHSEYSVLVNTIKELEAEKKQFKAL